MTVAELIEQLRELPPDMEVWQTWWYAFWPKPMESLPKPREIIRTERADGSGGWWISAERDCIVETKTVLLIG